MHVGVGAEAGHIAGGQEHVVIEHGIVFLGGERRIGGSLDVERAGQTDCLEILLNLSSEVLDPVVDDEEREGEVLLARLLEQGLRLLGVVLVDGGSLMVGRVVLRQVGRERLRLAAELVGDELVVVDGVEEGLTGRACR